MLLLPVQCQQNMACAIATEESLGIEYDEQTVCDVCQDVSKEISVGTERVIAPLVFIIAFFSFQSFKGHIAVVITCVCFSLYTIPVMQYSYIFVCHSLCSMKEKSQMT